MPKKNDQKPIFVIQKHHARSLHYDFRLEMDHVLKSWAVPKEPSTQIGVRRLAIEVEDHDLDYADFEGEIAAGEYGAGTVEIWDKGTYNLLSRKENKIIFELHGGRLRGKYTLVQFSKEKKNWILFRAKD